MGPKKLFTFSVTCVVQIQFTFDEDQVESEDEAGDDPTPTNKALKELECDLLEHIGQSYAVDSVEIANGGGDWLLLGIVEDDD